MKYININLDDITAVNFIKISSNSNNDILQEELRTNWHAGILINKNYILWGERLSRCYWEVNIRSITNELIVPCVENDKNELQVTVIPEELEHNWSPENDLLFFFDEYIKANQQREREMIQDYADAIMTYPTPREVIREILLFRRISDGNILPYHKYFKYNKSGKIK